MPNSASPTGYKAFYLKRKSRQLPTFPGKPSIIGVRELDFRVRNGNGYCLSTMATGILMPKPGATGFRRRVAAGLPWLTKGNAPGLAAPAAEGARARTRRKR